VEVPLTIAPIMSAPATCRATTVDGTAKAASGDYVPLSNQVVTVPPTGLGSISVKVKATATPFAQKSFSVVVSNCTGDGALGISRSTSTVTLIGQLGQPSSVELQYQKVVIVAPGIGKIGYQNVLVRNVGGAAVTFTVTSPISDSHFALVSPPPFPITIAAGQVYTMRFSYRATATALTRSSLSVQASTDQHAEIINLLGETG
ncbi:MAG: hypothetical protein WCK25_02805, partial [Actinomycetes bacterium]